MGKFLKRLNIIGLIMLIVLSAICFCACRPSNKKDIATFKEDSIVTYEQIEKKDGIIASESFVWKNLDVINEFCRDNKMVLISSDSSNIATTNLLANKYLGVDESAGELRVAPICVCLNVDADMIKLEDIFDDELILNYYPNVYDGNGDYRELTYFDRLYTQNESQKYSYVGTTCIEISEEILIAGENDSNDIININYNITVSLEKGYRLNSFESAFLMSEDIYASEREIITEQEKLSATDISEEILLSDIAKASGEVHAWRVENNDDEGFEKAVLSFQQKMSYKTLIYDEVDTAYTFGKLQIDNDGSAPEFREELSPDILCTKLWGIWLIIDRMEELFPTTD